ncbi:unnamed protein product [Tuber aestivum]|uniref:Uncharacterized protein n=1 Tax=Tuber aestivum TaxID=59557 RepID=A0A292Q6J3_9PEZI|nr:unnamed protein product [Tuber aestivum]
MDPPLHTTPTPLPLSTKLPLTLLPSLMLGTTLGMALGAKRSALVFRAENAHRIPRTTRGWYFYHKSKNYYTMLGAAREGMRSGMRVAGWVGGFVLAGGVVGEVLGPLGGGVVAGLSVAGVFSWINRFSYGMAVTTAKRGLFFGLLFGAGEEAVGYIGRKKREIEEQRGSEGTTR